MALGLSGCERKMHPRAAKAADKKEKKVNLDQLIAELQALREKHGGETDVAAWEYAGGVDDLCNVRPKHDAELNVVVMETAGRHDSGARR